MESVACFVPDDAYKLLDDVIDAVKTRLPSTRIQNRSTKKARALAIGRITSEVLIEKGFALAIPTETLGDSLVSRHETGERPRHVFDCDTASLIYMTVADALSMPASLVEIPLSSGDQHNYVRWQIAPKTEVNWDPNGRSQCVTPDNLVGYQGKSLTRDQTMSYVLTLRADLWVRQKSFERAIADYREAIRLFPERPGAYSGLAWLVATREFAGRVKYRYAALAAAKRAASLRRNADNLDTLACAYAFAGDFDRALDSERAAIEIEPLNSQYSRRVQNFKANPPNDCTFMQ